MARRHHDRRRTKETPGMDVTTFMNLMVVLVPFLLITAVFSRIAVVELTLPSSSGGSADNKPAFMVEVIVRSQRCFPSVRTFSLASMYEFRNSPMR